MLSSSFCLILLATSVLAADPPVRHVRKFDLSKRQVTPDMIKLGAPCGYISGNPDDTICEIAIDNVTCAPICCMNSKDKFVDGCPIGDRCEFDKDNEKRLRCCDVNKKKCGPRPTRCANFGAQVTKSDIVVCPSATPTCVTRDEGGVACTGSQEDPPPATAAPTSDKKPSKPTQTGSVDNDGKPSETKKIPSATSEVAELAPTITTGPGDDTGAGAPGPASSVQEQPSSQATTAPTSTGESSGQGLVIAENPMFGLMVAIAIGFRIFF